MSSSMTRRHLLNRSAQFGLLAGVGDFAFLNQLPAIADEPERSIVRLQADIEPLVRLIEDTPRERLLQAAAERVRGGTSYQEFIGAVMLAGVRGIQPRPVGFKFHAVLVINSAHLASQAATDRDRWLPLFWALDNFKESQERNRREGDWRMAPVNDARLPAAAQARQRFIEAMDRWDEEGADLAVAALARSAGGNEIAELFFRYGCRDFRDIGHKAIYVANSWRTLQTMGLRHAEPIFRSLAYALLDRGRQNNPAENDYPADRPYRDNLRRVPRIRNGWQRGRISRDASADLLATLRSATPGDASERVVVMLNDNIDPASIWDGLFLAAGEFLMRRPGIVGLHCVTTVNALHYAFQASGNDETRRMLMLQGAAFLTMFRATLFPNGGIGDDMRLDRLQATAARGEGPAVVEEIFADVSRDRMAAARKTLAWLDANPENAHTLLAAARRLIFSRGTNSHDYKFSAAVLEDFFHTTPAWRNRFLATGMFNLTGSGGRETELYRRMRDVLARA